jgi:hypothetical protein
MSLSNKISLNDLMSLPVPSGIRRAKALEWRRSAEAELAQISHIAFAHAVRDRLDQLREITKQGDPDQVVSEIDRLVAVLDRWVALHRDAA